MSPSLRGAVAGDSVAVLEKATKTHTVTAGGVTLTVELDQPALTLRLRTAELERTVAGRVRAMLSKRYAAGQDADGRRLPSLSAATVERRRQRLAQPETASRASRWRGGRGGDLTTPLHESGSLAAGVRVVVGSDGTAVQVVHDAGREDAVRHYGVDRIVAIPSDAGRAIEQDCQRHLDRIVQES